MHCFPCNTMTPSSNQVTPTPMETCYFQQQAKANRGIPSHRGSIGMSGGGSSAPRNTCGNTTWSSRICWKRQIAHTRRWVSSKSPPKHVLSLTAAGYHRPEAKQRKHIRSSCKPKGNRSGYSLHTSLKHHGGLLLTPCRANRSQLPLSFFSSLFGMNIVELGDGSKVTLGVALAYIGAYAAT